MPLERSLPDHFIFDRGELSEAALAPAAVVGAFDPGDDGQAEVLAGCPALAVQDVFLEQRGGDNAAMESFFALMMP